MKMDVRTRRFGGIEQDVVEPTAMHRVDHFTVVAAITLQLHTAIAEVHHAATHHHRARQHVFVQSGCTQRMQATLGQREVDRAARFVAAHALVGAFFQHIDMPAAARQQGSQQGTGESGAGDEDTTGCDRQSGFQKSGARAPLRDRHYRAQHVEVAVIQRGG